MWYVTHQPGVDSLFHVHSFDNNNFTGAATSTALAECVRQATWLKKLRQVHCTVKWQCLSLVNWRCLFSQTPDYRNHFTCLPHHNSVQLGGQNLYIHTDEPFFQHQPKHHCGQAPASAHWVVNTLTTPSTRHKELVADRRTVTLSNVYRT